MNIWCLESGDEICICEVLLMIYELKHKHTCSVRSPGVSAHEREPCFFLLLRWIVLHSVLPHQCRLAENRLLPNLPGVLLSLCGVTA